MLDIIYGLQMALAAVLDELRENSDPQERAWLAFEAQHYRQQLREIGA